MIYLDEKYLKVLLDNFPYSINVTDAQGVVVYANKKFLEGTNDGVGEREIGNYNIFNEENLEKWGLKAHIEKAFCGEEILTPNLKLAYKETQGKYSKEYDFVTIYHDIHSFPIKDEAGALRYVVTLFIPVKKSVGRCEVISAKEYIEVHWLEDFHINKIAKFSNMSPSRLITVFKETAGMTLHEYYIEVKMTHLKDALKKENMSITNAFLETGLAYNSYYVKMFKMKVGMTPREYKKHYK